MGWLRLQLTMGWLRLQLIMGWLQLIMGWLQLIMGWLMTAAHYGLFTAASLRLIVIGSPHGGQRGVDIPPGVSVISHHKPFENLPFPLFW